MEYIIYNKKTDRIYVMYFNHFTWSGSVYYGSQKWNFDAKKYVELIANNLDIDFIGRL